MLYSIIDVETTGGTKNKITDISIYTTDCKTIVREFHTLVNPNIPIPYFITRLTGISNEMVENAPYFHEVAKQVLEATRDSIFVAHNVNFDFNVIKNEFKELGYAFSRKKLCTVKLSRKIIPGHKSYSLGKICADLDIPIHGRHRAKGDAFATLQLFKLLYNKTDDVFFQNLITHRQITVSNILSEQDLNTLPNTIGVYYFWNQANQIIYIGKSITIKDRVISHFRSAVKKEIKLCQETVKVTYENTGSDLIAQLKESAEIKKFYPLFNYRQKKIGETYGLTYFTNNQNIIELKIDYLKSITNPLLTFNKADKARQFLRNCIEKNNLCLKYSSLEKGKGSCFYFQLKKCKGICCGKQSVKEYNKVILKVITSLQPKKIKDSIFTSGRTSGEIGVVQIENGVYKGYGFLKKGTDISDTRLINDSLIKQKDNRDVRRIISSYMKNDLS
jgi:DNA polymerase-3 subunit epsilon